MYMKRKIMYEPTAGKRKIPSNNYKSDLSVPLMIVERDQKIITITMTPVVCGRWYEGRQVITIC